MRTQENALFERWRASLPETQQATFVSDGAVNPEAYDKCPLKILLLLKEVNNPESVFICLRDFLAEHGGRKETWDSVTRWLYAIRSLPAEVDWANLKKVTEAERFEQLRSIAVMNLKKTSGHHTVDKKAWWAAVQQDRAYIEEQFAFYGADLVICCGSDVRYAFDLCFKHSGYPEWRHTSRGVEYLEYAARKFVVAYSHPEARVSANLIHFGLVDAVREIFHCGPIQS
jgi:hypothetical protein